MILFALIPLVLLFGKYAFQSVYVNAQVSVMGRVCEIPLAGLVFSGCSGPESVQAISIPDYPKLIGLQTKFEGILESSSGGSLALDLQYSEMAVRDLATAVKNSDLHDKVILYEKLEEFVGSAIQAGVELRTLGSRVGGVVDGYVVQITRLLTTTDKPRSILTVDQSAIRTLEAINNRAQERTKNIWWRSTSAARRIEQADRTALLTTFTHATLEMERDLQTLIIMAEGATGLLDILNNQLWVISDIISRTGNFVALQSDQLVCCFRKGLAHH